MAGSNSGTRLPGWFAPGSAIPAVWSWASYLALCAPVPPLESGHSHHIRGVVGRTKCINIVEGI